MHACNIVYKITNELIGVGSPVIPGFSMKYKEGEYWLTVSLLISCNVRDQDEVLQDLLKKLVDMLEKIKNVVGVFDIRYITSKDDVVQKDFFAGHLCSNASIEMCVRDMDLHD